MNRVFLFIPFKLPSHCYLLSFLMASSEMCPLVLSHWKALLHIFLLLVYNETLLCKKMCCVCVCTVCNVNSHTFEDPCFMAYIMILLGKWPMGMGKNVRSVVLKVVKMSLRLNRWVMPKRIPIDFPSTQAVSYRVGSVEIFHKNALFSLSFQFCPFGSWVFRGGGWMCEDTDLFSALEELTSVTVKGPFWASLIQGMLPVSSSLSCPWLVACLFSAFFSSTGGFIRCNSVVLFYWFLQGL